MKAYVDVICYKSKTLADGSHPLMLRITKSRKRKYVSIGVTVQPQFWDFDKNRPKRNCPNKVQIEKLIAAKTAEYNDLILDLSAEQRDYTPQSLTTILDNKVARLTVGEMYAVMIAEMTASERLGNLAVYKYSLRSLLKFTRNALDIPFADVDAGFLKRYEDWLRSRGCKDTTKSQLFRTLRSVFNRAIERGIVKQDAYPFTRYKLTKFDTTTAKRSISKEDVQKIAGLGLDSEPFYVRFARDVFLFSYFGAGINFTDIALLRFSDIKNDRVHYIRKKTGKPIGFPLTDLTRSVIARYGGGLWGSSGDLGSRDSDDYIFPILDRRVHATEQQRRNRIHKVLGHVNRSLKEIGLPNLTTYVARHTYATVLKRSGVNIAIISESLGHSDLATTQIYLDSFENSQIDEAMKNLLWGWDAR